MHTSLRRILAITMWCLLSTSVVFARGLIQGEDCEIAADRVIEGSLFTLCQKLHIAGRVEGNVLGIALRASITGEVEGNVYLAGLQLDLEGTVLRDLHYAGLALNLRSSGAEPKEPVQGQLAFATLSTSLARTAYHQGAVTGVGYQFIVDGAIQGEINYWGWALHLDNSIVGDVHATVGNPESDASDLETLLLPLDIALETANPGLTMGGSAAIDGNLTYQGPAKAEIEGKVSGVIEYHSTRPAIVQNVPEKGAVNAFLARFLRETMVLLTVGLLALAFAAKQIQLPLDPLRWRPVPSFVIGMLLFIVSFPITLILLLLTTIVMLLLALLQLDGVLLVLGSLLALVDIFSVGLFYFTAIFLARAVVAFGLGRLILRLGFGNDIAKRTQVASLIVGVLVIACLSALPVVGFVFNAGALFLGLGAITRVAANGLHSLRNQRAGVADMAGHHPLTN